MGFIQGFDSSWPFDPFQAAACMGAKVVWDSVDNGSGGVRFEVSGPVVRINPDQSEGRLRFTLCHELGHVALADPAFRASLCRSGPTMGEQAEERLCDEVAAELLMPSHLVPLPDGHWLSLAAIRGWAEESATSISASAARLIETFNIDAALLRMKRFSAGWFPELSIAIGGVSELTLSDYSTWQLDNETTDVDRVADLDFIHGSTKQAVPCEYRLWGFYDRRADRVRPTSALIVAHGLRTNSRLLGVR